MSAGKGALVAGAVFVRARRRTARPPSATLQEQHRRAAASGARLGCHEPPAACLPSPHPPKQSGGCPRCEARGKGGRYGNRDKPYQPTAMAAVTTKSAIRENGAPERDDQRRPPRCAREDRGQWWAVTCNSNGAGWKPALPHNCKRKFNRQGGRHKANANARFWFAETGFIAAALRETGRGQYKEISFGDYDGSGG
jgi:hypothetical protein